MKKESNRLLAYPPPPPPSSSPQSQRNIRRLLVVAFIIVIVVVAAVVIVLFTGIGGDFNPFGGDSGSPLDGADGGGSASANTLEFSYSFYDEGDEWQWTQMWWVKDIGSSDFKMSILVSEGGKDAEYIVNGELEEAWMVGDDTNWQWQELSYESQWNTWYSTWQVYWSKLQQYANAYANKDFMTQYNIMAEKRLDYNVAGGKMMCDTPSVDNMIPDSRFQPDL